MGVVWKAFDTTLDREVAIKILPDAVAQDTDRLARFEREAKLLASLKHPGIAAVYGLHLSDTTRFLAMELAEGENLSQRLGRGALPVDEARHVAAQVAEALEVAHENGVVHRDLKPANIQLSPDGKVKVLDFGLAKAFEREPASSEPGLSPTLTSAGTQAGMILGTAAYMSPEQARGRPVDHRSDVWSFGIVLHEMLTGQPLFQGETVSDTLAAVLTREFDPDALPEQTPRHLRDLLRRCLDREITQRLQAVGEARIVLTGDAPEEFDATPAAAASGTPAPGRPRLLGAAALVLALIALPSAYFLGRGGSEAGSVEPSPTAGHFAQLTQEPGPELFPSLSPDGKSILYDRLDGDNRDIFRQRVGGQIPMNLTADSEADDSQAAFSPDGESIAFRSERDGGGLFVMGATGESVRRLTDFGYNPAWSPDGSQIVFAAESVVATPTSRGTISELWLVESSSGVTRRLFEGDAVQPDWSPDGSRIAFWSAGATGGQRDIYTVDASGQDLTEVTQDAATDWSPLWSPDGRYLYYSSNRGGEWNLWRTPMDERSGRVTGEAEPVTAGVGAGAFHGSFSQDGTRLAFSSGAELFNIEKIGFDPRAGRVDAASIETVVGGSLTTTMPHVSPDGEWLAYTTNGRREDVFVTRLDGTQRRRLTDDAAKDRLPRWSPDGQRIMFYSDRSGTYQLWTIRPDGSDLRRIEGQPETDNLLAEWSPDGRRIAYSAFRTGDAVILTLDEAGVVVDAETLPRPGPERMFIPRSWTTDGRRFVGELRRLDYDVAGNAIYDVESKTYQTLGQGDHSSPVFLSDGRRLLYSTGDAIHLLDTTTGTDHEVISLAPDLVGSLMSLAPDERWIYYARQSFEADVWVLTLP